MVILSSISLFYEVGLEKYFDYSHYSEFEGIEVKTRENNPYNMLRFMICVLLFFMVSYATSRECNPDDGTNPGPCDPNVCKLPDCACEKSEPDVPLADRPQVIF